MEQQPEGDILDAVQSGDIATVKKFLDEGVPVDLTDEEGWSLLHHAAARGQVEVINLLREKGYRVDLIDNKGRTPFHYAAINGDIETIRLLIAMGSNVNSVDNEGNTPWKWSVMFEQNTAIEELTKHGGTVDVEEMEPSADNLDRPALLLPFQDPGHILGDRNNEVCQSNQTELSTDIQHYSTAAKWNDSYKYSDDHSHQTDLVTTQQCMDTNADTTQLGGDIFEAAQCGDTDTVKGYLDLGVPVNVTDEDGWSPVHHAIAHCRVEVIRLLMDRGCLMNPVKNRKQAIKSSDLHITTEGGSKYSTYGAKQLYEDIFEAARCGDTATIQSYLNSGGPVDITDEDGRTFLHCAAGEGQIKVVELLIKGGCCVNPVDKNGWTPSIYATACGHVQTVQLLKQQSKEHLVEQFSTDSVDNHHRRALHFAAASGDIHLIEKLADKGFYVNIGDDEGRTPLHYAATCGQLESVLTLLRLGGKESMTKVAGTGVTPLHITTAMGHKDIVSLLLNEGCPIDVVDRGGASVLHYAAQYGQIHIIEMLSRQQLDVNIGDNVGSTPLHYAAACGQFESVCTLLRLGGRESMTKVAGTGGTPLHQAVAGGHKDIVSLLLNEGCPINVVDIEGASVLHIAAQCGQIHMIEMLADQGLDVNIDYKEGLTPLHKAAAYGQLESVHTLLRLGGRESMIKVAGEHGTPLLQAVVVGHKDIVSLLLNEGCPINAVDSKGRSVLHFASRYGQIHMIEILAEQGLDVNIVDNEGRTPLHAAAYGQLDSVRTLLRLGGRESMTKVSGKWGTPLHQAVAGGCEDIVSLLLNEGCPINVVDSEGRCALHYAADKGRIKIVELLIKKGCCIDPVDKNECTPLDYATACGHVPTVQLLKQWKEYSRGRSPLHFAAASGHLDRIEMLAEQGLEINIGNAEGCTPLHTAAACGQLESVRTLLRLGGRELMTKVAGKLGTPLHQAVAKDHKGIVSLLLNEGCPINVVDSEGASALHIAARYGHIHMIEMLAEQGLDANIGDNEGQTPLHDSAAIGQFKSVRTLLRFGGRESITKVASTRGTPLHQAVVKGHKHIVSLLLNEGCPINVVDSEGRSVLHFAAQCGQTHIIEMLAEQGLDINIVDNRGLNPLHAAATYGQLESVRALLRLGGRESMTKAAGRGGTPLHQAVSKGHKDIVSLLLNEGCPINVVSSRGTDLFHWVAESGQIHMIEMLLEQGLDVNIGDDDGCTSLHYAAVFGHVTTFKELVNVGGNMHHIDKFGMKFSDWILIMQNFVTVKQLCVACGIECDDKNLLGVISALIANNLLDMNRILCLAAVYGNISIFDAMVTSPYPLNQQKMPKIAIVLSDRFMERKLPDQFHVSEEPLNPLHISILSKYFNIVQNIKFIEKLTSHPRTRYAVNELFPNGLSPLDVARRFELHDIAVIIERAGGGPGVWAGLPKEIEDKAIDRFTTLKELRRGLGEDVISRIVSMLGYPLFISDQQEVKKILEEKPKRSFMQKHVLSFLKNKRKWERVGDLLKVDEDILEKISEEAIDDDDAYYSMLKYWLKHGHNVSWKTLLDAVGDFETKKTVDHITNKIVGELAPSQVRI